MTALTGMIGGVMAHAPSRRSLVRDVLVPHLLVVPFLLAAYVALPFVLAAALVVRAGRRLRAPPPGVTP